MLNGSARAFLSATFDKAACHVLVARLRVLAAPMEQAASRRHGVKLVFDQNVVSVRYTVCGLGEPSVGVVAREDLDVVEVDR